MTRKFVLALFVFSFLFNYSKSQERNDFGVLLGSSYYLGDFNVGQQFYQPLPAFGALFRHNLSSMYSLRLSGAFGWVKGSYDASDHFLPFNPNPFNYTLVEFEGVVEIGFLPFDTKQGTKNRITPYVVLGIGGAYVNSRFIGHLPMGLGVKYSPMDRWAIGFEWRLHKTAFDKMDNFEIDGGIVTNKDWFSIAGLFVSYRLFKQGATCPAYK